MDLFAKLWNIIQFCKISKSNLRVKFGSLRCRRFGGGLYGSYWGFVLATVFLIAARYRYGTHAEHNSEYR